MSPLFLAELEIMLKSQYSVVSLLPHAPPMVLLDEVVGRTGTEVSASVALHEHSPFFVEGKGVPSYVGLEYMAQTCGVFAGLESLEKGHPVRLGFLLGTRNFHASVPWFKPGEVLVVTVREIFRQETMGVFDCLIKCGDRDVASAQLNLYQPEESVVVSDNF